MQIKIIIMKYKRQLLDDSMCAICVLPNPSTSTSAMERNNSFYNHYNVLFLLCNDHNLPYNKTIRVNHF